MGFTPTTEAFAEHVKWANFQVPIWKSACGENPTQQLANKFGWIEDILNKSMNPVTVPSGVNIGQPEILQMVRCGCVKGPSCSGARNNTQVTGALVCFPK